MKLEETKPYLALLLLSIIIGFSYLFAKIALEYTSPENLLAHRFIFTFICMLILKLIRNKKSEIKKENIKYLILMGLLYPVFFFLFQAYGLMSVSSSQAGIITATIPVFTLIIATFYLKEKATIMQVVGILFSVAGIVYLQYINNEVSGNFSLSGVILVLLSVLSITMQQIYIRKYKNMFSVFDMTYGVVVVGFIIFTILAISKNITDGSLKEFLFPITNINYLIAVLYLSVLSTVSVTFLTVYSLSKLTAVKVSMANNFSTLPSILAGIIVLNEPFTVMHWIGAIMIVLGVIMVSYFAPKEEKLGEEYDKISSN